MQPTLTESSSVDAWDGVGCGGAGGKNSKGLEDTVEGDGYIHYLDSCDSCLRLYGHQMFPNQTLNRARLPMLSTVCYVQLSVLIRPQ